MRPILRPTDKTLLGPGDDAAVVATPDGRVVASTDLLVESRHFRRDWSTAERRRAQGRGPRLRRHRRDGGAVPTALLVGFAAPGALDVDWVDGLMAGLREECGAVGRRGRRAAT